MSYGMKLRVTRCGLPALTSGTADRGLTQDCETLYFSYFQFLPFPSAIHSIALFTRRARVSSPLASAIHCEYSRLWLGGNFSKAAAAFLLDFSACRSSRGTSSLDAGFLARGCLTPASLRRAASLK